MKDMDVHNECVCMPLVMCGVDISNYTIAHVYDIGNESNSLPTTIILDVSSVKEDTHYLNCPERETTSTLR